MNFVDLAERGLPDWMIRLGIRKLLAATLREERLRRGNDFVNRLRAQPIAIATNEANAQHYEVPAEFFEATLGPRLKYSCCLFEDNRATLAQAEEAMLALTCERAEIEDGMDLLDLGCGWGSLSLWLAEKYPRCRITSLSNSRPQREFIQARCRERGFKNVSVVTANITEYDSADEFDRVVSIEMFEHVRNYERLLANLASWLRPGGKLFVHIFCHRDLCYPFDSADGSWMSRRFFSGGIMPSFDLLSRFDRDMVVSRSWSVDGRHYARTCEAWLQNLDANLGRLQLVFERRYGRAEAKVAVQRWRMFMMACAELFGFGKNGSEWLVGHYLMEPATIRSRLKAEAVS